MLNRIMGLAALMLMNEAGAGEGGAPAAGGKPAKKAAEVEKVTMEDGRIVDFVGKRRMLKESIFAENGHVDHIRLDFRNGQTILFKIPHDLFHKFAAHGAEQKLGDETAGEDDVDDMYLAVEELVGRLHKGEWSIAREGGGMSGTSILLKALVEHSAGKKTVEQIKEFLKGKTPAEKAALRASSKLKPIVDRLEAEKVAKNSKVDADALLAAL